MTEWRREVFAVKVRGERGPEWRDVSGHTDGVFGLDRRRYLDDDLRFGFGYCVTHRQTGFAIRYVHGKLSAAKGFAAALHTADWSFDDVSKAKLDGRGEAAQSACQKFPNSNGTGWDAPTFVEARNGETGPISPTSENGSGSTEGEGAGPQDIAQ